MEIIELWKEWTSEIFKTGHKKKTNLKYISLKDYFNAKSKMGKMLKTN